jgi:hypothetical protein
MYWFMNGATVTSSSVGSIGPDWSVVHTGDVSGDGRTDIVWSSGAQMIVSLSDGASFSTAYLRSHPPGWRVVGGGDINADGRSDLIWRNADNTQFMHWFMNGASVSATAASSIGPDWDVVRTADISGDGRTDIVWSSGAQMIVSISEGTSFSTLYLRTHPAGWRSVGGGALRQAVARSDVNGDGESDVVFRNASNTQFMWWLLRGASVIGTGAGAIGPDWAVVHTGDVSGDGRADIVWSTGQQVIVSISEGPSFSTLYVQAHPPGWRVVGGGDVNGDGTSDLIWRNDGNTQFMFWLMRGASVIGTGAGAIGADWSVVHTGDVSGDGRTDIVWSTGHQMIVSISEGISFATAYLQAHPPGWRVVGGGDINGDGRSDLVWRNAANTQFMFWLMRGASVIGTGASVIGPEWSAVHIADVSGDGRSDIVWTTGQQMIASISEGISFSTVYVQAQPAGWRVVGGTL